MRPLLLLALCLATSYYTTIKDKTRALHDLTGLSTYYEFFGLGENATRDQIKRAFRRLRRAAPPAPLTSEQYKGLVDSGYSLLFSIRGAYDDFLSQSKYLYLDEGANYRNHFYLVLLAGLLALLFLDAFVYAVRYVRYYDGLEKMRIAKRARKQARARGGAVDEGAASGTAPRKQPGPPTSVVQSLFRRARRCLGK